PGTAASPATATAPVAAATCSRGSRRRPMATTWAPSARNRAAVAAPIPVPPPVTSATFPSSRSSPPPPDPSPSPSVPAGGPDAAELPVAAQRGRHDLLRARWLGPHVVADGDGPRDDVVGERAEPLDLHRDHVAGLHRPRVRRRAGQDHIAGRERDGPRDVGDEVPHAPDHLVGVPVLADLAV